MNFIMHIEVKHLGYHWWTAETYVNHAPDGVTLWGGTQSTWVGNGSTAARALEDLMLRSNEFIPKYVTQE